jgi:hypothetical protein
MEGVRIMAEKNLHKTRDQKSLMTTGSKAVMRNCSLSFFHALKKLQ